MARRLAFGAFVVLAAGAVTLGAIGARTPGTGISAPPPITLHVWNADTDNLVPANGTVTVHGAPVSGVRVRVDNYDLPAATDKNGAFAYLVDATLLQRHVLRVTDASAGKVNGQALTAAEQSALTASQASIDVAYAVKDLKVSRNGAGDPVVSGRLVKTDGTPPPSVGLLTYQLTGTVTGADGKPVVGAQVSTRTLDRDYWTVSTVTDSTGHYDSLFTASAETAGNPVPFTVRISKGDVVYQFLSQEFVNFQRLKSAELDIKLPPAGYSLAIPHPRSYPGATYAGTAVGVTSGTNAIKPLSATWPDGKGRFTITLPKTMAGKAVSIWEGKLNLFSIAAATPGGAVDLQNWPATVPADAPRGLATITLK